MKPALLRVTAAEAVGPYTLLRVERGALDPGIPGQFFMLEAPGRLLPRPMSLCSAPEGELGFLIDPIGPGTRALCAVRPGDALHVLGPLGNGFRLEVTRPLLVGGGIGVAPFPYLAAALEAPRLVVGFRSEWHAEAARFLNQCRISQSKTVGGLSDRQRAELVGLFDR
jgi:dihydroorotate dehydrogenase electron transfer subunit